MDSRHAEQLPDVEPRLTMRIYDSAVMKQEASTTEGAEELNALRERVRHLEAELEALRRAHDVQSRHLISERLAIADQVEAEITPLREEIEWRIEVMEEQAKHLAVLKESRSLRYTEPLRRIAAALRRR
jgi:hypothetical protein